VIPLDALLRDATDAPRRNLVTRPTGAAVRDRVLDTLRGAPRTEALLDFSRIGLVDYSCADEVVAKLVVAVHELSVSRVILHGIREDQAEAIDHALARHGLTVLALELDGGRPILLGEVPGDWRSVFEVLCRQGEAAASSIADQLAWEVARVQPALDGLVTSRCIVRTADGNCSVGVLA
jgi:hypothetical protein